MEEVASACHGIEFAALAPSHVALAFQQSLGTWLVPDLARSFRTAHPGVRFRLTQSRDEPDFVILDGGNADLELGSPMQRLLMGEVGSGKTVVAMWAMLRAVENVSGWSVRRTVQCSAERRPRKPDSATIGMSVNFGSP